MKTYSLLLISLLLLILTGSCEKNDPVVETETMTIELYGKTITMIYCPGGTYLTNNDDGDTDFEDGPEVTVDPFWISETEVTNDIVVKVFNAGSGILPDGSGITSGSSIFNKVDVNAHNYLCEDYVKWGVQPLIYMGGSPLYGFYDIVYDIGFDDRSGRDDYPCTDITWYGAIMVCNWLTAHSSTTGGIVYSGIETDEEWWAYQTVCNYNKTGFRLPTTAEWECAARWQGSDNSGDCYEYPADSGQYWTRGGSASGEPSLSNDKQPVKGNRKANALGLYDMTANVWEWCYDEVDSWKSRIIRSGDNDIPRISATWDYPADGTAGDLGFRLVMSADD
ncbi:MAG: SUMF1/EgtB/PvdO family nonheme iron enzyme [Bacteroidales bacterium]|nr:SUMF1/EgtB/PvdO family nonheme iron enzyme [Bacteroidales bacterium]MDT8373442.1 SUMF1/EgtB/PvdO family nonheme iron enzyme [Bacteroidales bacterium]